MDVEFAGHECLKGAPPFTPLEVAQVVTVEGIGQDILRVVLHRVHCPEYRSSIPQVRR